MKRTICRKRWLKLIVFLFVSALFPVTAQTIEAQQADQNGGIFMNYFRKNWDDIHDVIMRFHNDNPGLKGIVFINMNWQEGNLVSASVDSNDTGNPAFGLSLIEAMKKWQIPGLTGNWATTLPVRTAIYGSNSPEFTGCGIFTGNVTDIKGNPVKGARLILTPGKNVEAKPDTVYSNREGIFICTLIRPGDWQIECSKKGYSPAIIDKLTSEKGIHLKRSIILEAVKSVTVPFVLDHNRMLVEAEFQLSDGKWHKAVLWVDTGNPDFFISEEFAGDLGIELNDTVKKMEIPFPEKVRIGDMMINFDSVKSSVSPGLQWVFNTMHNDGNLPSTVLQRYHVVFDYPGRQLTISEPGILEPRGVRSPASVNPVTGIIQLDAVIDGKKYSFALDNGASVSIVPDALVTKLLKKHPDWPKKIGAVGCANIWGWWPEEENWLLARVPEIKWGAIDIKDAVMVGVPPFFHGGTDIATWYSKKSAQPVNGFLGPNVFKTYRVEIDYAGSAVYFEKGTEPDVRDMDIVGLTLRPLNDKRYEVVGIVKNDGKPVVEGIQQGDILLRIDGLETTGATMGTVIDALRGTLGEKHVLVLEREGSQFTVEAVVEHIL